MRFVKKALTVLYRKAKKIKKYWRKTLFYSNRYRSIDSNRSFNFSMEPTEVREISVIANYHYHYTHFVRNTFHNLLIKLTTKTMCFHTKLYFTNSVIPLNVILLRFDLEQTSSKHLIIILRQTSIPITKTNTLYFIIIAITLLLGH